MDTKTAGKTLAQSALILGGGKGRRMGYDKKLLSLHGERVLFRLIEKLSACFDEVLLSMNDEGENRRIYAESCRVTPVSDIIGTGPLAGIYAGLTACKSAYLYVCACDMPFINEGFIEYMRSRIGEDAARNAAKDNPKAAYLFRDKTKAGEKNRGYEPFNAFYGKCFMSEIHGALMREEYKIASLFETANIHIIEKKEIELFGGADMFFNINRRDDLAAAEKMDGGVGSPPPEVRGSQGCLY